LAKVQPLRIDTISIPGVEGIIGVTSCPGWREADPGDQLNERLIGDLLTIRTWGADTLLTLLDDTELLALGISELGSYAETFNMNWLQLPTPNIGIPDEHFNTKWQKYGSHLCNLLRSNRRVVIHCRDGVGRAGPVAAHLLAEMGTPPEQAFTSVVKSRSKSLRLHSQEKNSDSLLTAEGFFKLLDQS